MDQLQKKKQEMVERNQHLLYTQLQEAANTAAKLNSLVLDEKTAEHLAIINRLLEQM
jgi:hypothetical protein